ncbi:MAG TPA: cytosine permease [Actinomycetota bacterium]|nr:cytosine permease [Actinomycetota bacterium]
MTTVSERLERVVEQEAPSWGVEPTSTDVRRLREMDFAVLWGDLAVGVLVVVAGALLVPGLGLPLALLAIAIGSFLGSVPLAMVGRAGAREGVPGMVLLRPVLGTRGSYLPTVLNVAQLVGWTAFELWAMALVAGEITGPLFGVESFYIWLAVAAAVCVALSLGGPVLVVRRWMERFGAWVLVAAAAWITFRVLTTVDLAEVWSRPATGGFPTFGGAIDIVIALPVSWIPLVADYNRFARRGVSSAAGTLAGFAVGNAWFFALGALLVLGGGSTPTPSGVAEGIATLAGGALVLVVLLVGETDEAFADIYSAAVSTQNLAPRFRQRLGIIATTAVGVGLAAWLFGLPDEGVLTYEFFLLLLGSVFVPLFAVFVADYFVLRRSRGYAGDALFDDRGPYRYTGGFNLPAIAAWILGFLSYHLLTEVGPATWVSWVKGVFDAFGLEHPLFGGTVPASVVSFFVASLAYLTLPGAHRRGGAARSR